MKGVGHRVLEPGGDSFQATAHLDTIHVWHADVQKDDVGWIARGRFQASDPDGMGLTRYPRWPSI